MCFVLNCAIYVKPVSVWWNTLQELLGYKLNYKLYLKMSRTNDEFHIKPQLDERGSGIANGIRANH